MEQEGARVMQEAARMWATHKGYKEYEISFSQLEVCFKSPFTSNCSFALIFCDHTIITSLWKATNLLLQDMWKNYFL